MSYVAARWFCANATALVAGVLLTGCAVGPDFHEPAPPEITRYTRDSLTSPPSAPGQRFVEGQDIPQEWWTLYKSPALNALVERSLQNNPNLQSALATLRAAQDNVAAQQGKYFPLVSANFNPTRQRTAAVIAPVLAAGPNPFNLDTAQLTVSYSFDIWGLNRRTVESLEALADVQHFQVEAAYLTLTSNVVVAAVTEASLRGQIEATLSLIATVSEMRDTLKRQLDAGYANRSDLAAEEAALAQA